MITTSNGKVTVLTCWPWTDIQNCPRWPLCPTYGQEVKGQTKVKFQTSSNDKSSSINVLALDKLQKILTVTSLSNLWLKGQRSNFTKCKLNMRLCSDLFTDLVSSSSVNTSKSYISDMTWPILTRLGHKYRLTIPFMWHDQIRVKGHVGVTGVKKVIFTKNATSPTDYRVWSCDSCTCISLTPSTKVMGLKIHPGSFGVTGVKKVIFTKNATSPTNYRVWSCDSCTYISLTPSTKVMGLKIHPGSFGVTGVKRSFSLKTLLLLQFTGYGHVTHVHASAWPPSTKVMGLKIHPGSFGVTGVKRLFSLKTLLLLQITG